MVYKINFDEKKLTKSIINALNITFVQQLLTHSHNFEIFHKNYYPTCVESFMRVPWESYSIFSVRCVLTEQCWSYNPEARPTFKDCLSLLLTIPADASLTVHNINYLTDLGKYYYFIIFVTFVYD